MLLLYSYICNVLCVCDVHIYVVQWFCICVRLKYLYPTAHTAKEKGLKKLFKRGKQTAVDTSTTTNGPTT